MKKELFLVCSECKKSFKVGFENIDKGGNKKIGVQCSGCDMVLNLSINTDGDVVLDRGGVLRDCLDKPEEATIYKIDMKKIDNMIVGAQKTGFTLENKIVDILKESGWTVIANRNYIDDVEDVVREIDVLAYKCSKLEHFNLYTALIISCKKSDSNVWSFFARKGDFNNPNLDWSPVRVCSNENSIIFSQSSPGFSKSYHEEMLSFGLHRIFERPSVEIFAYQEISKDNGKPQNDKPIFSSVTTLMKAQEYEAISVLNKNEGAKVVYQFNLLSVVDSDMLRLFFSGGDVYPCYVNNENYIAHYLINKKNVFSRIRFLRPEVFKTAIKDYDLLHSKNCEWFLKKFNDFYLNIMESSDRRNYVGRFAGEEIKKIASSLLDGKASDLGDVLFLWNKEGKDVSIFVTNDDNDVNKLNGDKRTRERVQKVLKDFFKYEGEFSFSSIPF